MPKLIEQLQEKLLMEARRQVLEEGYQSFNIRNVARNCGVAVGTVYNYYPSKDALIASFLAKDWMDCLERINKQTAENPGLITVLTAVYKELTDFHACYADFFQSASAKIPAPPRRYHILMRNQIGQLIRPFCEDDFQAEFAAEAMMTWTIEERPFADIFRLIEKTI